MKRMIMVVIAVVFVVAMAMTATVNAADMVCNGKAEFVSSPDKTKTTSLAGKWYWRSSPDGQWVLQVMSYQGAQKPGDNDSVCQYVLQLKQPQRIGTKDESAGWKQFASTR